MIDDSFLAYLLIPSLAPLLACSFVRIHFYWLITRLLAWLRACSCDQIFDCFWSSVAHSPRSFWLLASAAIDDSVGRRSTDQSLGTSTPRTLRSSDALVLGRSGPRTLWSWELDALVLSRSSLQPPQFMLQSSDTPVLGRLWRHMPMNFVHG